MVALAGNPNVGKSTLFNGLTGMHQHTGNWPGKTVLSAQGHCESKQQSYVLVDIPGTYSLMAHSAEEEVARNFICFGEPDAVVVVCDATCLERNLNLVLQTMEISKRVLVCVNLLDEAKRKGIWVDLPLLSKRLGVPVVGTVAQKKESQDQLLSSLDALVSGEEGEALHLLYPQVIEEVIAQITVIVEQKAKGRIPARWLSLKLLEEDASLVQELKAYFGEEFLEDAELLESIREARQMLAERGLDQDKMEDLVVSALMERAAEICDGVVTYEKPPYSGFDRRLDRILTGRRLGYPLMFAMLMAVFWLTITGANYPSQLLSSGFFWLQERLTEFFVYLNAPEWLHGILVLGVYRVPAWVISVMLPPMAIFFPLFTLLEDAGYLPRVAYNLDHTFKRCCACGKQALCMCMGGKVYA